MKILALLALTPLAASCFDASAGVEALYWKPCHDAFRYGFYSSGPGGTEPPQFPLDLIPDYAWGFRIFGTLSEPCQNYLVNLEWAHVSGTTSAIAGPRANLSLNQELFDTAFAQQVGSLLARQHTRYNKLSLKVGYRFCTTNTATIYGYGGGRWVDIAIRERSTGIFPSNPFPIEVKQTGSLNGGAFEIGMGARFNLWCGFGAGLRFGVLAIIGEQENSLFVGQGLAISAEQTFRMTRCLRGLEARLAIDYTYTCGCWWVRGEIGYEIDTYFSALSLNLPQATAANAVSSNFTIGGPFAGVTIGF